MTWHRCRKYNWWRASANGLKDSEEKKKLHLKSIILFKTKMQKLYPIFDQNDWKTIPFGGGGHSKGEQAWSILKLVKNKANAPHL